MTQNVVGTFRTVSDAEAALRALLETGLTNEQVSLITHSGGAIDDSATSALARGAVETALAEGAHVPEADLRAATDGPRANDAFIIVRHLSDELLERATAVMERYNVVNLEYRSEEYGPGDWEHADDTTVAPSSGVQTTMSRIYAVPQPATHDDGIQTDQAVPSYEDDQGLVSKLKDQLSTVRTMDRTELQEQLVERTDEALLVTGERLQEAAQRVRDVAPDGQVGALATQAADALETGGQYLQHTDVHTLREDLAMQIRQRPIPALLVGVGLGFVLGRMLRR